MYSTSLLVLALAVFGASAQTFLSSGLNNCGTGFNGVTGLNGFNGFNGVSGLNGFNGFNGVSGLNGFNGVTGVTGVSTGVGASTPVIENVPLRLPSIVHPTSVQESCNCIKTVVRPTVRKEVYSIPSVQRFLQTTSTPVVETVPYVTGSAVDVPAAGGVETGLIGSGVSGGVFSGVNNGFLSGANNGFLSGVNNGFVSGLNNGFVSGVNNGFVSGVNGGLLSGVNSGVVSGVNSGLSCGF